MPKTLEIFKNTLKKIYNNLNNNNLITIKKPHTQTLFFLNWALQLQTLELLILATFY